MSQQHIDLWKQAADAFDKSYQAIGDAGWASATPCQGWAVKELVDHAVGTQGGMLGGVIGAEVPEGADWPTTRAAMDAALQVEGVLEGTTEFGPMGQVPKSMVLGVGTSDLLIHAWDVARAVGADETLPAEAVTATYMGLQKFPEQAMRGEGMFGAAIECAADADEQTKMLSFAGRQV
ncbi:MAG: TIGR03086 family metal-binding protein [Acidimicrobiales bacterium]